MIEQVTDRLLSTAQAAELLASNLNMNAVYWDGYLARDRSSAQNGGPMQVPFLKSATSRRIFYSEASLTKFVEKAKLLIAVSTAVLNPGSVKRGIVIQVAA